MGMWPPVECSGEGGRVDVAGGSEVSYGEYHLEARQMSPSGASKLLSGNDAPEPGLQGSAPAPLDTVPALSSSFTVTCARNMIDDAPPSHELHFRPRWPLLFAISPSEKSTAGF
jgi:hypothetical protein